MESKIQKQENENSINSDGGVQPSTVMRSKDKETGSKEDGNLGPKTEVPEVSQESGEEREVKVMKPKEKDFVIDVRHGRGSIGGEVLIEEKICRICHMSSRNSSENSELIQLGCGCKDELGASHRHCAETWFKQRGTRQCEICGKTAKNITGIQENQDTRIFMPEWNEMRLMSSSAANPPRRESLCRCRHSCNFLWALLVLAFMLSWFFRVDML